MSEDGQAMETRVAIVENEVERHKHLFSEIHQTLKQVNENLKEQAVHERDRYHHSQALERAFGRIESIEATVGNIEQEMPTLKLSRRVILWLGLGGGVSILGLVLTAIYYMVA